MLTFRMDETNFAEGDRDEIRIATGIGLKVDFDEFATDGSTVGLWHLHDGGCQGEGTGLEDSSGGGRDFSNNGAASVEDGYEFVRDDNDYMDAAFDGEPEHSTLTLECWVRGFAVPVESYGVIFSWDSGANNLIYLRALRRRSSDGRSLLLVNGTGGGVAMPQLLWIDAFPGPGGDVTDMLEGDDPWHVAVVLDGDTWRLYVNGIERDLDNAQTLAADDYKLRLGHYYTVYQGYNLSAVLDEVRLSSAARHAADFTPRRLLASGMYTSPTFDGIRIKADWTGLVRTQTVPPGCTVTYDVRADDETDAGGDPQALWQAYSGDPADLPDGRHFQWRATLTATADHLTSPTIESVEAHASEAGYNLYHATGDGPQSLAYTEPWARVGPGITEAETDSLDTGAVHWFGARPTDASGRESPVTQGEVRLEIDAQGEREADRPAGALAISARPLPLGAARLEWRYRVGTGGVLPQTFRIFGDGGTGTIDYESPLDEVPYHADPAWYTWASNPLTPGFEHQLAVRAVGAGGVWDEQPAVGRITPDATPPAEVDALEAEMTL